MVEKPIVLFLKVIESLLLSNNNEFPPTGFIATEREAKSKYYVFTRRLNDYFSRTGKKACVHSANSEILIQ
jgi:hypothetical protein